METPNKTWIRITASPVFIGMDRRWIALRVGECFTIN
jgi:hypothetical protein